MLKHSALISSLRTNVLRSAKAPFARVITSKPALSRTPQHQHRAFTKPNKAAGSLRNRQWQRWQLVRPHMWQIIRRNSTRSPGHEVDNSKARSVTERFRELSRRYGWAAVGVYFGLSILDFPFCFLAVRLVGPERVGEVEHAIVDGFWTLVGFLMPSMGPDERKTVGDGDIAGGREGRDADTTMVKPKENASIWTQLLLAYGVHKSLIFFRVPLTAAVTPKIVKTLRQWGWNIGRPNKVAAGVQK